MSTKKRQNALNPITVKKFLTGLNLMSRDPTFDVRILSKTCSLNAVTYTVLRNTMQWIVLVKPYTYKYVGPTPPTEEDAMKLNNAMKEYSYMIKAARKKLKEQKGVTTEDTKDTVKLAAPSLKDDIIESAALLAEVGIKLGKTDLYSFIKQGLQSV